MDLGYHNTLGRAMLMHVSAEDNIIQSRQACVNLMNKCIGDLEQRSDKHRFLELCHQPFAVPRRFDFQPHKGDEVSTAPWSHGVTTLLSCDMAALVSH